MNKEEKNALKELDIFTNSREDMKAISMADLKILYNLILRLLRENQSYIDYLGTPPCYEDSKYVSKDKIREIIKELNIDIERNNRRKIEHIVENNCESWSNILIYYEPEIVKMRLVKLLEE